MYRITMLSHHSAHEVAWPHCLRNITWIPHWPRPSVLHELSSDQDPAAERFQQTWQQIYGYTKNSCQYYFWKPTCMHLNIILGFRSIFLILLETLVLRTTWHSQSHWNKQQFSPQNALWETSQSLKDTLRFLVALVCIYACFWEPLDNMSNTQFDIYAILNPKSRETTLNPKSRQKQP